MSTTIDPRSRVAKKPGAAPEPARTVEGASPQPVSGFNGNRRVPPPVNEPVRSYAPGTSERAALKDRLKSMAAERIDIPLIIGGR
jgi:hypothetical protein